jgi:UDP-glucose 4-epimerase
MTWLVVGGAGYIGAHVVHRLRRDDRKVVVLDDLSTGVPERVPADVPLIVASSADGRAVSHALREHDVTGVAFLAGRKSATRWVTTVPTSSRCGCSSRR